MIGMRMREYDRKKGRIVAIGETRYLGEWCTNCVLGIQRQAEVQQNPGAILLKFDTVSPDLLCATMDADTH
jgi:hypothetical protein